jgi:hypothetical protein
LLAKPGFGKTAYKRRQSMVQTILRGHKIEATKRKATHYSIAPKCVICEIDNHADTTCLCPNFVPLFYTGVKCEVKAFAASYEPIKSGLVCSAVTAYDDDETGLTYLLEFQECLWMLEQLEHILINPNQIQSFGIPLSDDPYDKGRPLGFVDPVSNQYIPFKVQGNILCMTTRTPTEEEVELCQRRIQLTSNAPWDLYNDPDPIIISSTMSNNLMSLILLTRK